MDKHVYFLLLFLTHLHLGLAQDYFDYEQILQAQNESDQDYFQDIKNVTQDQNFLPLDFLSQTFGTILDFFQPNEAIEENESDESDETIKENEEMTTISPEVDENYRFLFPNQENLEDLCLKRDLEFVQLPTQLTWLPDKTSRVIFQTKEAFDVKANGSCLVLVQKGIEKPSFQKTIKVEPLKPDIKVRYSL